ncbi:MAG TPA: DUF6531 domain-containing protein [Solirubrobacterales bacterium]|nr:DUF6531 domain-containing protein [Solirubrobacterales bacterium]
MINSVSGMPSGWIRKDATQRTISVTASDEGLGVQSVRMISPGSKEWHWNQPSCTGLYGNRCANTRSGQITYESGGFPFEGEVPVSVQGFDPTGKGYNPRSYTLLVDGTSPTINLSGQLANVTEETGATEKNQTLGEDELSLPTYKLKIEAKDGTESELRSGVKEIRLYLDNGNTPVATQSQSCPAGSCPMTMNYSLKLPDLSEGKHTLKIVAEDQAGNVVRPERKIEFEYIPATGMKEDYVLQHFPLPDGHDYSEERESHGPELAVNVMNGNLVYHERDVQVQTSRASLELERIYNSQLPSAKDGQWGHGWSLAQTPELKPDAGESPPQKATMVQTSAITSAVNIPTSESQETFSSKLHATIDKTSSGGYEVSSEIKNETSVFNANGRIEETRFTSQSEAETLPPPADPTYLSSFGSSGTGGGQFAHPAGIAVDTSGNLWVADENNHRVEKFNAAGEYLSSFGSSGTGNGQFGRPTDVAIAANGNLWVTDASNNRLEEFSPSGEFLKAFGSSGTGNGQFSGPECLAIDSQGNIWVGDTYHGRLQEFNEAGEFIKVVSSRGSAEGQMIEPTGIATAPDGSVWVADWGNQRVEVFTESGGFIRQFGAEGTGNAQFKRPDVVEVDAKGDVWIGDQNNERVQEFTQSGEYVGQFGTAGSGAGQFSFGWPMGITSDAQGHLWVSDTGNNRVQEWRVGEEAGGSSPYSPAPSVTYGYSGSGGELNEMAMTEPASGENPSLDLTLTEGLASSASGEAAGTTSYGYESGKLMTEQDPEGETKYGYDSSGRLNHIELPNGTWASIVYDSTSRVTEVTVNAAGGSPKTTHFWYGAEPRETRVWGGGNPEVTYSIGEDGSVFKWSYTEVPPAIDSISGSLWANRNSTAPIENKDHTLFVTGSSPHEIASVQILVNGNAVVAEKTCEDNAEPPEHNCEHVTLEWITNAAEHPAGQLNLDVVVTDFLGHSTAERFFVTIPQQPPSDPEAPEKPSFDSIKEFREEFGLDREHSYTESQMNALILELLYEWELQRPAAVLAVEKWGVPMRSPEVAEMEYRERYIDQASEVIPEWGEEHALSTYGGMYVNNREGGKIYVGFTENQASQVTALKQGAGLIGAAQVYEYPTPPENAIGSLEATEESVVSAIMSDESLFNATSTVSVSAESDIVEVTASNPGEVREALANRFGANAPISVVADEFPITPTAYSRYHISGPVDGGDSIQTNTEECTASFSARAQVGEHGGIPTYAWFNLTAGHCFPKEAEVIRRASREPSPIATVGTVRRRVWGSADGQSHTDSEAIRIDPGLVSSRVFFGDPRGLLPMLGMERVRLHRNYCWSGVRGGTNCGMAIHRVRYKREGRFTTEIYVNGPAANGDSGGPVWDPATQKAVGQISAHSPAPGKPCHSISGNSTWCPRMTFTPLLPFKGKSYPDGVISAMGIEFVKGG